MKRKAIRPSLIMVFVGAGFGVVLVFVSLHGESLGIDNIGLFFTVCSGTLLVIRPIVGRIIDRFNYHIVSIPGFAFYIMAMIVLSVSKTLTGFLVAAVLTAIAFGSLRTSLHTMAVLDVAPDRFGAANATFFTGLDAGIGLGGLLAGILSTWFGYSMMFLLFTIPLFFGAILYLFLICNIKKPQKKMVLEE